MGRLGSSSHALSVTQNAEWQSFRELEAARQTRYWAEKARLLRAGVPLPGYLHRCCVSQCMPACHRWPTWLPELGVHKGRDRLAQAVLMHSAQVPH